MGSFRACELLVTACGIWFPDQGANPGPLHWELRVLATGPLEKPLQLNVCALAVMSLSFQKHCDWRAVKGWSDRGLRSSHSDAGKMTLRRLQKVCLCVCVCVCLWCRCAPREHKGELLDLQQSGDLQDRKRNEEWYRGNAMVCHQFQITRFYTLRLSLWKRMNQHSTTIAILGSFLLMVLILSSIFD